MLVCEMSAIVHKYPFFLFIYIFLPFKLWLIQNIVSVSCVQLYVVSYYMLLEDIEYSLMRYTVNTDIYLFYI